MQENNCHKRLGMWMRVIAWLFCALFFSLPNVVAGPLRQYNSNNYVVHTDMPFGHVRNFSRHMDRVFDEYKRRFEKLNLTNNIKQNRMNLYLFETQDGYVQFLASKGIPSENTGGMFVINPKVNGLFTYIKDRPVRQTLSTLQHEGFHQFAFSYIGPSLPIWVNEGIAQFFEDGVLVGKRFHLDVANARRLNQVKTVIENNRTLPFANLIGMSDKTWAENVRKEPGLASLQYDQSWSMVYFLINSNDKLLAAFNQYLIAVSKGVDSEDAFVNSFSLKSNSFARLTADFEVAWKRYTRELTPNSISQVTDNMNFLAHGLLWIKKSKRPTPQNTAALRADLQRVNYRISRTVHGVETKFSADDESLYRYELPNGNTAMLNLSQDRDNRLPPTVSAPGLKPSPTLVWYYMDGDLMYDVTYK